MKNLMNHCYLLLLCIATASCTETKSKPKPVAPASAPPMALETLVIKNDSVSLQSNFAATIEGVQTVEIRPFVSGFIKDIRIVEGAEVKKGDILFQLNNEPQLQAVRAAEALVKVAELQVAIAEVEVQRITPLVEKDIMSQVELKTKQNQLNGAKAQLEQAKASYQTAKENLAFTVVRAPVNGVVGDLPYKLGSLVSSATAKPLTTVSNIEKVFAYFTLTEKDYLSYNRKNTGRSQSERLAAIAPVDLILSDGTSYNLQGKVVAINGLVNQRTGGVSYKAEFPNPSQLLRSGSSGNVVMTRAVSNTIVIPEFASYEIQGKRFVYLCDTEGTIHSTAVTVDPQTIENQFIVTSGLKAGDRIVTEGIVKLRDGMKIKL